MHTHAAAAIAAVLSLPLTTFAQTTAGETILGVYMFHRHGDRTAKAHPPTNLTDLGYQQVYSSGDYYKSRYLDADSSMRIAGMSAEVVKQSQIAVTAPVDVVLQNSAQAFLQGLYPPLGSTASAQVLRDNTTVTAPLNGYQLIPVNTVSSGTGSEDNGWLQSTNDCFNAQTSSNEYFYTPAYTSLLSSTQDYYTNLSPVINATFNASQTSFKNAYTIFDLIHVATIHNQTIDGASILTPDVLVQLQSLANTHEWNLAYNASSTIRAIQGAVLAAQVTQFLNTTLTDLYSGSSANKLAVQFGAYGTFSSFFGLASLQLADPRFYGIVDYASSMAFELFTTSDYTSGKLPADADLNVRFTFHNGTTNSTSTPAAYPLFGGSTNTLSWSDFTTQMSKFSIGDTQSWCQACGNSTGTCAPDAIGSGSSSSSSSGSDGGDSSSSGGMSLAVAGVIGAMVTLGVVLLAETGVILLGGLRLVSKKRLVGGRAVANGGKA